MDFTNRVVVVVGAGHSVGPQIVEAFAQAKAKVVVDAPEQDVWKGAPGVIAVAPAQSRWAEFFDRCEAAAGPVDILVHSPKIVKTKSALDLDADELRRLIDEELVDVLGCLLEATRRMAARGRGRVITLVSMSGKTGVHKNVAAYAAAKGGVIAFSRSLAADVAGRGVTVNCIATALFEPQVAAVSAEHRKELTQGIPVGRFGKAIEAAHAVLYLAADEGAFVTGETLNLSGGRFMD